MLNLKRLSPSPEASLPAKPHSPAREQLARHQELMRERQARLEAGPMRLQRAASDARFAHEGAVRELAAFNDAHAGRVKAWAEAGGTGELPVVAADERARLVRQVEEKLALLEARESAAAAVEPMRVQLCRELDGLRDGRSSLVDGVLEEEVVKLARRYRALLVPVIEAEAAIDALRAAAQRRGNGTLASKCVLALRTGHLGGTGPALERDRVQAKEASARARDRWAAFAEAVEGDSSAPAPTSEEDA